jgi:hypothetical protein
MPPNSEAPGKHTLNVEVTGVLAEGLRISIEGTEYFLSYENFPWFKDARTPEIRHVTQPQAGHLYWPDLDIDLAVESIKTPEKYPLIWKERSRGSRARR